MQDAVFVQVLKAQKHTSNEKFWTVVIILFALTGLFFGEFPVLADVIAEIAARHQINNEVQVLCIFEGVVHVDQEPTDG